MFDLCKFLNVKEGQEFKINSYRSNYRIMNNYLEVLNKDNEWTTNQAIDINDLANCGIRFPRKELRKELLDLFKLIDRKYKWIAKDSISIKLFEHKPLRDTEYGLWRQNDEGGAYTPINHFLFPYIFDDLSWQDEEPLFIPDYVEEV